MSYRMGSGPGGAAAGRGSTPIRLRTLPNGMRLVSEQLAGVRSCAIGVWVDMGSRWEQPDEAGLSHFIEHMLFKGTARLDTHGIADAINELGGNVNAFTSQEQLCLHARTIDVKGPAALDLLAQLLLDSTFPVAEVRRERGVILEECKMYEDNPEELTLDVFMRNLWPEHPLGRPVIGRRGTIRSFDRERLVEFWRRELRPERIVVVISGAFDAGAMARVIRRRFMPLTARGRGSRPRQKRPVGAISRQSCLRRTIEQSHFCLGTAAPMRRSPERFGFGLMNLILGGGVSSRLFQEIREKRGLAYSIGSFTQYFNDAGSFAVSGGTSPTLLSEVLRITVDEIERICEEDVSERELELARSQVIDSLLLGMENTETRMMRMADAVLTHGRVLGTEEIIKRVNEVDAAAVRASARKYLRSGPLALSCVGPSRPSLPAGLRAWP